jgi:acyl carrier protein
MNEATLRAEIRRFVLNELLMGDAQSVVGDGESFLETGAIDSTGVLEVVMFVEQQYELSVLDREMIPENLDSIDRLVQFVLRKKNAA